MKRLHEIDIIRTIAILLVVLTHSFAIYTGAWEISDKSVHYIYEYSIFVRLMQAFRMPAIVLVAGYVYRYLNRQQGIKELLISKFKRLFLPSIIFSTIYVFLFNNKEVEVVELVNKILSGAGHLWFLPMLFWNFLIGYFLIKLKTYKITSKLLIIIGLYIVSMSSNAFLPNVLGVSSALEFTVYFYIGIQLYELRDFSIKYLSLKYIMLYFIVFIIIFVLSEYVRLKLEDIAINPSYKTLCRLVLKHINGFFGVLYFYLLILFFVEKQKISISLSFKKLTKKTYGIYVFHQFVLIYIIYYLKFYEVIDYRLAPFIYFIVSFLSSLLITNIFLKFKFGRYLIG